MSKRQLIILLAALIIIIALFSGLPTSWNTTLYVIISLFIIIIAYATTRPASIFISNNNLVSNSKTPTAPFVDTKMSGTKVNDTSVNTIVEEPVESAASISSLEKPLPHA